MYGRAYLMHTHTHHVLSAWTRTPEGVEQSEMLETYRHIGVGPADSTSELTTLGGKCKDCRALLESLPDAPDPRGGA